MNISLRIALSVYILLAGISGVYSQTEKRLPHELKRVKLYQNLAEMTHTAQVDLNGGLYILVFSEIDNSAVVGSEQVTGNGIGTLLSVVMRRNIGSRRKEDQKLKVLNDSLFVLRARLEELNAIKEAYEMEQDLLSKNISISSTQTGLSANSLLQMADFFRVRARELNLLVVRSDQAIALLEKRITEIEFEQNVQWQITRHDSKEIVVTYEALSAGPVEFLFSYQSPNARWSPTYDLRIGKIDEPISLGLKAFITNSTGYDWRKIDLVLSSGSPKKRLKAPTLASWELFLKTPLSENEPMSMSGEDFRRLATRDVNMSTATSDGVFVNGEVPISTAADYTTRWQTTLAVEYNIKLRYDIPSDGEAYMVQLQNFSLPAEFNYYSAPKVERNVYLQAGISGWENYSLVPGRANIFLNGSYLGQTFLNPESIEDTLQIALGQDSRIIVLREKLKEKSKVGDKIKSSFTYLITVRNNKTESVELKLEDVIPRSNTSEIEVEVFALSSGNYDPETGKIQWNLKLKAGESKVLRLSFEVRYPKDRQIEGLN